MAYKNLSEFIEVLEKNNELIRIKTKVNTELEISEITDRFSKLADGGKALLFENTGYDFPVLMNAFGSDKRINLALGVNNLNEIADEISGLLKNLSSPKDNIFQKLKLLPELGRIASWMPKKRNGRGECQEVIHKNPDINILPVLKTWPADGGKFITLPTVVTRDPVTGIRNVGMYRLQIFDSKTTGMHWHLHKTGARHYNEYKEKNLQMPVSICIGGDPAYTYAATAPLPDNLDEYILAGFLRKKKVETVKCITNDLEVPADVDFVIEGYVDTSEELVCEGPFGDHTGFYSLPDLYPKFHITCITHRKNAVYPATIVGIPPQEDAYIGKATERIFLAPIQLTMLPELSDMHLPFAGVAHNLTLVSIKKTYRGQAQKVMNALWGAGQMMFNKILMIFEQEQNLNNYKELARAVSQKCNPESDIFFSSGPSDVLDHAVNEFAYGSKICFDVTANTSKNTDIPNINKEQILSVDSNISDVNTALLNDNISVVILSIKNEEKITIAEKILKQVPDAVNVKFWILTDDNADINDLFQIVWLSGNNIDPLRDVKIKGNSLLVDAGAKHYNNSFKRNWPNPVVMNDETISLVDKRWNEYFTGQEFISSPSLKYKKLMKGTSAFAFRNNDNDSC